MKIKNLNTWAFLVLLNFIIVAIAGSIMRYKFIAPLPAIDHRNVMHAHSYFAFTSWVSLSLFILLLKKTGTTSFAQLTPFYASSLFTFISLFIYGFSGISLALIILTFLCAMPVIIAIVKGSAQGKNLFKPLVLTALFYYLLSQAGLVFLAYNMSFSHQTQSLYLGTLYFYLHFSYNGWFTFAMLALAGSFLQSTNLRQFNTLVLSLALCALPAYFLSLLWMKPPDIIKIITIVTAVIQLMVFVTLMLKILKNQGTISLKHKTTRILWSLAFLAMGIKFLFQFLSVIPVFSELAFAHRSIIIGYIHLVLLGFVTLFLIGLFIEDNLWQVNSKKAIGGIAILAGGIILNELILFTQGLLATQFTAFSSATYLLLFAALLMLSGVVLLIVANKNLIRK